MGWSSPSSPCHPNEPHLESFHTKTGRSNIQKIGPMTLIWKASKTGRSNLSNTQNRCHLKHVVSKMFYAEMHGMNHPPSPTFTGLLPTSKVQGGSILLNALNTEVKWLMFTPAISYSDYSQLGPHPPQPNVSAEIGLKILLICRERSDQRDLLTWECRQLNRKVPENVHELNIIKPHTRI